MWEPTSDSSEVMIKVVPERCHSKEIGDVKGGAWQREHTRVSSFSTAEPGNADGTVGSEL